MYQKSLKIVIYKKVINYHVKMIKNIIVVNLPTEAEHDFNLWYFSWVNIKYTHWFSANSWDSALIKTLYTVI